MAYGEDDFDGSKNKWINDTHEARREISDLRLQIPPEYVRTPPYNVPETVDFYNRLVADYASQLRPKRDQLGDKWEQTLTHVPIPKDGETVDVGAADEFGDFEEDPINRVPVTQKEVSLSNLEWWQQDAVIQYNISVIDPADGRVERTQTRKLYLPVYALDKAVSQLNDCLDNLGWLPETAVKDYEAGPNEVLTHE